MCGAEIRYLHASEGLSGRAIAARLGVARKTVAKALASDGPTVYKARPPVESAWIPGCGAVCRCW